MTCDDKHEDLHSQILRDYDASYSAERSQRELVVEDLQFSHVTGSMWSDNNNADSDRPRFEVNRIFHPINQIVGEQRQNPSSIKIRPVSDATTEDAEVLTSIIRSIEEDSSFTNTKDVAFKNVVGGGMGAWMITTEYEDDSFDQVIKIKSIPSPATSVYYDPSATDLLKRDASWIIVTHDIDKRAFQKLYPEAVSSGLSEYSVSSVSDWQARDTIRIGAYWVKEPIFIEIALMSDGQIIELTAETKQVLDDMAAAGNVILKTRKKKSYKVRMYKFTAAEILEGPLDWAGKYIPVVPIFGYSIDIAGQQYYQGIVRNAKDSNRIYNYATSQAIETSALSPKDPFWITKTQAKGHENMLANFTNTNSPFMLYNSDSEAPGPPQRSGAPSVQNALIQQIQQADMDIQNTTGLYSPALGMSDSDQSGKAILALQGKSNLSTYELQDNLNKGVAHTGTILVDLIPKILDTKRQVKLLGEDGSIDTIVINNTVIDQQTNQPVIVNDLSKGRYSVTSTSGPGFTTKRSEGLNLLVKLAETNPLFSQISADLIAKSVDFSFSEELTKRVRKVMLDQGLVDPNEEEIQEILAQPQAGPSLQDKMNFELQKLNLEQQAALVDQLELRNEKIRADISHKHAETQETLTDALETKTKINKTLDDMGIVANMPVEMGELAARQKNLQALNDSLELSNEDTIPDLQVTILPPLEEQ